MRVLLIEDEADIADAVRLGLEDARYQVDVAADGATGLRMAQEESYSVILLDVMLPGMSGWEVCRKLRARRDLTLILMLTARDAPEDRVRGLDLGADDYLPKPFDFPELLARIRALRRRDKMHRTRLIEIGDLKIDTGPRRVFRGGKEINLTEREYTLLEALVLREGQALSREYILDYVWQDEASTSNTVDVYISQLRKKIDADSSQRLIQTLHGIGYTVRIPEEL